jgi:Flp pilus assembly protein TadD
MARASAKTRTPDALYNQGVFEFNRGNVEAAIDIFEKALKSEPRADHLLYSLAAAYARGGDDVKSVEALRKAIAVNPVHRSHARHDPDFTPLRGNREFLRVSGLDLEINE